MMLQKYYSTDHITKRTRLNDGRLKKYYVTNNHEPIISRELFEKAKEIRELQDKQNPHIEPYDYNFKGMVYCGEYGGKYYRKKTDTGTAYEHFVWKCGTYSRKGKAFCASKQIPDSELMHLAESIVGEIEKIFVINGGRVRFLLKDGTEQILNRILSVFRSLWL